MSQAIQWRCLSEYSLRWIAITIVFFTLVVGQAAVNPVFAKRTTASGQKPPPNIVLIVADDLGYGELGCYGQKWIRTPNIDALADQGMRFTDFYAGAPVCAPSRCVLMTGKHLGHAYVRANGDHSKGNNEEMAERYHWEFPGQTPLPDEEITIGELLKQRGYTTAAIGKWGLGHFGTSGDPNRQGFDLFYGFNCQRHAHNHYPRFLWRNAEKVQFPGNDRTLKGKTYSQDKFTETALQFVREHQEDPFFLYLPFAIPHLSIQVPESSLAEYQGKIPEAEYEHRAYLKHPSPRAGYAAMVTHMDRDIGKIVELIDELGLKEDTLIIFTSDNGPTYDRLGGSDSEFFNSAGGFRGYKGSVYEGGIRVPMVASWPGQIPPNQVSDVPSAFWDLLPTICQVSGARVPEGVDGISIFPTLTGKGKQELHKYLLWEFPSYGTQQALRLGRWKGVRQKIAKGNKHLELYDLKNDPKESVDVSAKYPEIANKIDGLLQTERTESELFPLR